MTEHIVIPTQIRSRYPYSPDGWASFVPETEMRAGLPRESRVAASMRLDFRGEGPAPRARALRDAGADLLIVSGYRDAEATVAGLERFAVEVVPAL